MKTFAKQTEGAFYEFLNKVRLFISTSLLENNAQL